KITIIGRCPFWKASCSAGRSYVQTAYANQWRKLMKNGHRNASLYNSVVVLLLLFATTFAASTTLPSKTAIRN
ncbi:MAG: hypothetical protein JW863_16465, partial [Chitinispirillaceae bacterium]|nr:hypothetical protein [Chitinispirillaceae bacterium]